MAAYFVASYDVSDPYTYAKYNPGGMPQIMESMTRHGGEVLTAGTGADWIAGARQTSVIIKFPSVESAHAWVKDPQYDEVKGLRLDSTTNCVEFIAPAFVPPS